MNSSSWAVWGHRTGGTRPGVERKLRPSVARGPHRRRFRGGRGPPRPRAGEKLLSPTRRGAGLRLGPTTAQGPGGGCPTDIAGPRESSGSRPEDCARSPEGRPFLPHRKAPASPSRPVSSALPPSRLVRSGAPGHAAAGRGLLGAQVVHLKAWAGASRSDRDHVGLGSPGLRTADRGGHPRRGSARAAGECAPGGGAQRGVPRRGGAGASAAGAGAASARGSAGSPLAVCVRSGLATPTPLWFPTCLERNPLGKL